MLKFSELEMKYGSVVAYQCLAEIEKVARISSWTVAHIDPEIRLADAIRAQDAVSGERPIMLAA